VLTRRHWVLYVDNSKIGTRLTSLPPARRSQSCAPQPPLTPRCLRLANSVRLNRNLQAQGKVSIY
jgi:hypothetical protein